MTNAGYRSDCKLTNHTSYLTLQASNGTSSMSILEKNNPVIRMFQLCSKLIRPLGVSKALLKAYRYRYTFNNFFSVCVNVHSPQNRMQYNLGINYFSIVYTHQHRLILSISHLSNYRTNVSFSNEIYVLVISNWIFIYIWKVTWNLLKQLLVR